MKRAATMAIAMALLSSEYANARDPFEDERQALPPIEEPADAVAFVVPAGLYYVTDIYAGDVITTSGVTTTYSTSTVHESPGTYARVIDVVDTGASSAFDGTSFNGRGALTDGRALAGTYYENFVLTAAGYVPVSIVFYQDDAESRRRASALSPSPVPSTPAATAAPAVSAVASRAVVTPAPSFKPGAPIAPAARLQVGVALAPDGPTLGSAEVLRGRLVHFWPRAFANDIAVPIRSWRLVSAEPDRVSATVGNVEPLAAQWIRMPNAGVRWSLRFEIFTVLAPTERLEAQISITVRSPALID